jgi:hypothetical protein
MEIASIDGPTAVVKYEIDEQYPRFLSSEGFWAGSGVYVQTGIIGQSPRG